MGSESWPHRDMQRLAWTRLAPSLWMPADQYEHPAHAELAERLGGDTYAENRLQLLALRSNEQRRTMSGSIL